MSRSGRKIATLTLYDKCYRNNTNINNSYIIVIIYFNLYLDYRSQIANISQKYDPLIKVVDQLILQPINNRKSIINTRYNQRKKLHI